MFYLRLTDNDKYSENKWGFQDAPSQQCMQEKESFRFIYTTV